jgi:hypothetical protein
MLKFIEWSLLKEGLSIIDINPEDDWEYGEQAYRIAKEVGIRPSSDKSPTIIALNDKDEVIGAVFTSWSDDHEMSQEAGERVAQWNFDVVVDKKWQGYKMIGMQLIRRAEEEKKNLESMFDQKAQTKLWVVNPKLAKVLQHPKYGYNVDAEHGDGSAHLSKWD